MADTFARDGTYASTNYGSATTIDVKADATSYRREAFLRFNVSGLDSAKLVQLQLTPVNIGTDATATYTVELVTNDSWTEGGVLWSNRPSGSGVVLAKLAGLQVNLPVRLDITDQVKAKAAGDGFISLRIYGDAVGSQKFAYFASREHATPEFRPRLLVQE